jgi:hypothetical protein
MEIIKRQAKLENVTSRKASQKKAQVVPYALKTYISHESKGLHIKLGENERGALCVAGQDNVTSFNTTILDQ